MVNRHRSSKLAKRRNLRLESLEDRKLLAVDGVSIDFSQSGNVDLFGPNAGFWIHDSYRNQGLGGITINTSNVPGQNNENPVPTAKQFQATGNVPITGNLSDLLAGATDADGDAITFDSVDAAATQGDVTVDLQAGTFRYVPATGFNGQDSFEFIVSDSRGATGRAIATIKVTELKGATTLVELVGKDLFAPLQASLRQAPKASSRPAAREEKARKVE